MFSTFVAITIFVGFISVGSAVDDDDPSAYKAVTNCIQTGWNAIGSDLHARGGHAEDAEKVEELCIYFRAFAPCILSSADLSAAPVLFIIAHEWQHMVLAEKAGLCNKLPYGELRKIAKASGIMDIEHLVNTESDYYDPCAGDAMRHCLITAQTRYEKNVERQWFKMVQKYVRCFEKAAVTCKAQILRDFIANFEAFEEYLLREGNGKLRKMVEGINPPPP